MTPKPFNSKGHQFDTIQDAIDNLAGDGFVFVPNGTWNEALTITNDNVTLLGMNRENTIINGGAIGHGIEITGDGCELRNLQIKTTAGGGNDYNAIEVNGGTKTIIDNVYVSESDRDGISLWGASDDSVIRNTMVSTCDSNGLNFDAKVIVSIVAIDNCANYGIYLAGGCDDTVIAVIRIDTTGEDGIYIHADAENCLVDSYRITGWTNEPIDDDSATSTIGDGDTT